MDENEDSHSNLNGSIFKNVGIEKKYGDDQNGEMIDEQDCLS